VNKGEAEEETIPCEISNPTRAPVPVKVRFSRRGREQTRLKICECKKMEECTQREATVGENLWNGG
jgi:hypothetical protein